MYHLFQVLTKTAYTVTDVYYFTEKIGQNVIIVGGGLVGCEAALFLVKRKECYYY